MLPELLKTEPLKALTESSLCLGNNERMTIDAEVAAGEQRIAHLEGLHRRLSPIESVVAGNVAREIAAVKSRIGVMRRRITQPYRLVPLEVLRGALALRNEQGLPSVALFGTKSPSVTIVASLRWDRVSATVSPRLPAPVADCWNDVRRSLHNSAVARRKVIRATAVFDGLMPDRVREEMKKAEKQFASVHVLAEVAEWQIEERQPALRRDPLVLGFDGENFWLLDAFDLTPLEDALKQICEGKSPSA